MNVTKRQIVLKRSPHGYQHFATVIAFEQTNVDTGAIDRALSITRQDDELLGFPDQITVTIEPGDVLTPNDTLAPESVNV